MDIAMCELNEVYSPSSSNLLHVHYRRTFRTTLIPVTRTVKGYT